LPGTVALTAQRKQSKIEDGRQAASVPARAVFDGENAVVRWREQQDRPHPARCTHPPLGKRSAQARISEPGRRRQRWKPDGGETRAARLDAQHESAAGHVPLAGIAPH